jgi:dihydroorotase
MKILIKNATIVNADNIFEADILTANTRIVKVAKDITPPEPVDEVIDAKGKHVFPGFIDLHTHLRTPGREDEEDFLTGSQAAAAGGFTKIFCMPNTLPSIDNEGLAKWIFEESQKIGIVDIYPVGAITKNREGKELTEFGALRRVGCLSVSDDGVSLPDSLILRRALEYAKMIDILVVEHCEDLRLANKGAMRESFISSKYGVSAIPDIAESLIVARNIEMAKYLNTRIHLAHISTAKSVEFVKRAKNEGVKVTAETCPHYFMLTVDDIEENSFDARFKVNPPLGEKKDVEKIREALRDGVIDCIATDHAPHSHAEKELPFEDAPFGLIGLEFAFSLTYTHLVKAGILDLKEIANKLSANPAKIVGLSHCGVIQEGFIADIVIADLNRQWIIQEDKIRSKSKNTPFIGYQLYGVVEKTIHKGKIVFNEL